MTDAEFRAAAHEYLTHEVFQRARERQDAK